MATLSLIPTTFSTAPPTAASLKTAVSAMSWTMSMVVVVLATVTTTAIVATATPMMAIMEEEEEDKKVK